MPDPWTSAWAEAEASCPSTFAVYETVEFQHPGFVDESNNPIPLRYVIDAIDRNLGIELSASFNPGTMQVFSPTAMQCAKPEFAEGQMPSARLTIDNIGREIMPHLERAVGYAADLKVIFRSYRSDDTSTPIHGPVEFVMTDITTDGSTVEGRATISDFGDLKVPSLVYRTSDFPGLQA